MAVVKMKLVRCPVHLKAVKTSLKSERRQTRDLFPLLVWPGRFAATLTYTVQYFIWQSMRSCASQASLAHNLSLL